jgi:branched-chain amino acid transport system ATP-binding protein
MMLSVEDVNTSYGKSHILHEVSIDVVENEVVTLLGRNGVGKTTLLRTIMGLTPPSAGEVCFKGEEITGDDPHRIANRGIGFVPQERRLFPELTVAENLRMGLGPQPFDSDQLEFVHELFPRIEERADQRAGTLSGGEQQMVTIGRAMMSDPELLILDEPSEGLMPSLVPKIGAALTSIAELGYAILLVEQNVDLALEVTDRVYFMENGRIEAERTPTELADDDGPLQQYLGISRSDAQSE